MRLITGWCGQETSASALRKDDVTQSKMLASFRGTVGEVGVVLDGAGNDILCHVNLRHVPGNDLCGRVELQVFASEQPNTVKVLLKRDGPYWIWSIPGKANAFDYFAGSLIERTASEVFNRQIGPVFEVWVRIEAVA